MKSRIFLLLSLLAALALPTGLAAQSPSPAPQVLLDDSHRFVKNGAPWFPLGFYGAALNMTNGEWDNLTSTCAPGQRGTSASTAARCAFQAFADRLSARGLNFVRAWINWGAIPLSPTSSDWDYRIVHPYLRSSVPGAIDGGNKFDLDAIDPAYLQLLEDEIDYAAGQGLVVQVVLFDCWHVTNQASRDYYKSPNNVARNEKGNLIEVNWSSASDWTNPAHPVATYQKRFVQAVVGAIGDRPNIIWETCNEDLGKNVSTPATAVTAWDQMIATEIGLHDSLPHPVMPVDLPEHRTVAGYRTPAPSSAESVEAMHNRLRNPQFGWNLPLITDNDCCDPALADYGDIPREKAWGALTAGAHTNFFIDHVAISKGLMDRADIERGMTEVGYVQKFLNLLSVNLVDMAPADHLVTGGTGAWAYARPNDEFVVYLRKAGTATPSVTLSSLPSSYVAKWFNPRTGAAPTIASGGPTFVAPGSGDWALHVKSQGLSICQQPVAQTVTVGGSATFQAAACGGVAPYSYRWQFSSGGSFTNLTDGAGISGATTPSLFLTSISAGRAGSYRLRVTDSASGQSAQVFSSGATLTVNPATLGICEQSGDPSVGSGSPLTLSAFPCGGTLPYTYRWQFSGNGTTFSDISNGGIYSGATSPMLSISAVYNPGYYRIRITDAAAPPAQVIGTPIHVTLTTVCTPGPYTLCLQNGRFKVTAQFFEGTEPQAAFATHYSEWGGFFWFFSSNNTEVGIKVLQGSAAWWVFHGAATDQHYAFTVTDMQTGVEKSYNRPAGGMCGDKDFNAFPLGNLALTPEGSLAQNRAADSAYQGNTQGTCVPTGTQICQLDNRFRVEVKRNEVAQPGAAINSSTGVYWFYTPLNAEVFVKVLDARTINEAFWVFYGSMSDQEYDVIVTDTTNGQSKTYHNAFGTYCGGSDTAAFPQ